MYVGDIKIENKIFFSICDHIIFFHVIFDVLMSYDADEKKFTFDSESKKRKNTGVRE